MQNNYAKKLLDFIEQCPSCFHTIRTISDKLDSLGYTQLSEHKPIQKLTPGNGYYITRNLSSIIAFRIPQGTPSGFMLAASHSESPCFKIKPIPTLGGVYTRLNTERYGGMIYSTWFDRPLSIAGRITAETEFGIETRLVNIDRDLVLIPNVSLHLDRNINSGSEYQLQKDLFPLFSGEESTDEFINLVAAESGVKADNIIGTDLFLYNREHGSVWGAENEFFSAPRIDDLQCVFASFEGFLNSANTDAVPVFCVFDNEEVGSGTKQGALSTFLADTLTFIVCGMGLDMSEYRRLIASGMMLSADNGHAVHPNSPEFSDTVVRPVMNGGVIIKFNANQKYTTDAVSHGIFEKICKNANVPIQYYANRSDLPGGSTLGNFSAEKVSVNTVDIGAAQLAMHSAYETAGTHDTEHLISAISAFYSTEIYAEPFGAYKIVNKCKKGN